MNLRDKHFTGVWILKICLEFNISSRKTYWTVITLLIIWFICVCLFCYCVKKCVHVFFSQSIVGTVIYWIEGWLVWFAHLSLTLEMDAHKDIMNVFRRWKLSSVILQAVTRNNPHELTLARLHWELEQRKR